MDEISDLGYLHGQREPSLGIHTDSGCVERLGSRCWAQYIVKILKEQGIEPAPERNKKISWQEFLRAHWQVTAAADFFTVEVWTLQGLRRYLVFFVIELSTRRIRIAGIAPQPNALWMAQMARNLTDAVDGLLLGKRLLLQDRDLQTAGVKSLKMPARSPNLNAYAERFLRTIKLLPGSNDLLRRGQPATCDSGIRDPLSS